MSSRSDSNEPDYVTALWFLWICASITIGLIYLFVWGLSRGLFNLIDEFFTWHDGWTYSISLIIICIIIGLPLALFNKRSREDR